MKKKKIYKGITRMAPYNHSIHIDIYNTQKDMAKALKDIDGDNYDTCEGAVGIGKDKYLTLHLPKNANNTTIVHEIIHITDHLALEIGMPKSLSTTEAYAYMSGYLFDEITDHIRNAKKHYKKPKKEQVNDKTTKQPNNEML